MTILLLAAGFAVAAPPAVGADDTADAWSGLLVRAMSARGFHEVAGEIERTGSFLAASPAEAAAAVVASHQRFAAHERDALLLLLLREDHEPEALRRLVAEVFGHVQTLRDWSLLALVFERATEVGHRDRGASMAIADRIADALEVRDSSSVGYEPAAIAVSRHASATTAPTDPAALSLAEMLRTIARASRDARVVDAARESARILLSLP